MVFIQGGNFMMGSDSEKHERWEPLKPKQRQVTVGDYYLSKYEVTQAFWEDVMGFNPSHFSGCINCPVENVSWNEIQKFLKKLNQMTGKKYRLPTEAEWEYAARGGKNGKGYKYAGANELEKIAWHTDNSVKKTHPVGKLQPNELGIYDMSGNVWEWCSDAFDANDFSVNEAELTSGTYRVLRGGCWSTDADYSGVAYRNAAHLATSDTVCGFRLVLVQQ
jgi:formylglycine-generating enzyme required for sulfatase activity